jgi:hypothetical protein
MTTELTGIGTEKCIHLSKKIIDIINFSMHQLSIGNVEWGNFYLNVAKSLIWDNKNTDIYVSKEYIDEVETDVSKWK